MSARPNVAHDAARPLRSFGRCRNPSVISNTSVTLDAITKRELYEKNGVREDWIVNLETRSIAQFVLRRKRYVLTEFDESGVIRSAVLPGFEMTVGELLGA